MRGSRTKPAAYSLPYADGLATALRVTFFRPSHARGSCLPLAPFHRRGVTRVSWHQVLWVTGAWICCGRSPATASAFVSLVSVMSTLVLLDSVEARGSGPAALVVLGTSAREAICDRRADIPPAAG